MFNLGDPDEKNTLYVATGVSLVSTTDTAVRTTSLQNLAIIANGAIVGDENGIWLDDDTAGSPGASTIFRISITDDGLVHGANQDGLRLRSDNASTDAFYQITNEGEISSSRGWAINLDDAEESSIVNTGSIFTSRIFGISGPGGVTSAIRVSNAIDTITNIGVISSADLAFDIDLTDPSNASALATIASVLSGDAKGKSSGDLFVLQNTGEILSGGVALFSEGGVDDVSNDGFIQGDVWLDAYADEIANSGLIDGAVRLGDGDDALNGFGGRVTGLIDGGAGNDQIRSGYGDDFIIGGSGADFIHAGKGDDTASYEGSAAGVRIDLRNDFAVGRGGDADGDILHQVENIVGTDFYDELFGNDGANTLDGGGNVDSLRGFGGNDVLQGGGGGDALIGDAGEDRIIGGAGSDRMYGDEETGGADYADIFIFDDGDIGKFVGSGDRIVDFDALDIIDLSRIDADVTQAGDQAFTLLAQGVGFSGTAGEARINFLDGNRVLVFDTNGDGAEDGRIIFENNFTPIADQIIL
ncbi:MAG: calcium-binding protein [Pseudomonadota bacterium]